MIGLLGKKLGMSQIFDEKGALIPVTLIQAGPCPVLQKKMNEEHGYTAIQIGFDPKPLRRCNKPEVGLYEKITKEIEPKKEGEEKSEEKSSDKKSKKKLKLAIEPLRFVREIRIENPDEFNIGQVLDVNIFKAGEKVDVVGCSKGKGFQGPIKRWHSKRGPETHGSMYHRRTGSLGQSSDPSRVYKGKPMPGHMGNQRSTASNLQIIKTDKDKNILFVKGSVPGHPNSYVIISTSKKDIRKKSKVRK